MKILSAFALLLFSLPAMAGGFYVELGNPSASKDAAAKNAFAIARLIGCHHPERGNVTATAEGVVNGQRKSVPVNVVPLSTPGMFALAQTWPAEGKWVLLVAGNHPEINGTTSTLVRVKGGDYDRASAKMVMRPATKAEIDAFLE